MTLIERVELTNSQASIEFTSIPQTYTDLYVLVSLRGARVADFDDPVYRFNGDTGNNYSYRFLLGSGSTASSGSASSTSFNYVGVTNAANSTSNTFSNLGIYIPNYTSSTAKSSTVDSVSENNATASYQTIIANLWTGTAAINSIRLFSSYSTNFVAGSSATLYGITKGSDGTTTVS